MYMEEIHKNKMKKVLNELKNKHYRYINDLICQHVGEFISDVYFVGYNEDNQNYPWYPCFNLILDINCYFTGHSCWDFDCDCTSMFSNYVDEVLKKNPNSNIVKELQKIETSTIYCDEYEWEQFIEDLVTITLVDEIQPKLGIF